MSPLFGQLAAIAALLLGAGVTVLVPLRCSRDRNQIRTELEKRRCKLVQARSKPTGFVPGRKRAYDVDYLDPEIDLAHASCTVSRGMVTWDSNLFEPRVAVASARDLPTYGQNWRG